MRKAIMGILIAGVLGFFAANIFAQQIELKQSDSYNFELHILAVNAPIKVFIDEKLAVDEEVKDVPGAILPMHKVFKFYLTPGMHLFRVEANGYVGLQTTFEIYGSRRWGLLAKFSELSGPQKMYFGLEMKDEQIMYQ